MSNLAITNRKVARFVNGKSACSHIHNNNRVASVEMPGTEIYIFIHVKMNSEMRRSRSSDPQVRDRHISALCVVLVGCHFVGC